MSPIVYSLYSKTNNRKKWEFGKNIIMIFTDLEKAYDNVRRDKVWEALINMQVPESLIKRIMKGYEGSKC